MASGEEARRPSVSSSAVLEDLFPAGGSEPVCGDENPELVQLRERLQGWLSQYEPLLLWVQRLLVWERPLYSIFVALTLNTLFWLLSSTSLRPLFLLSLSILGLMQLERWKHKLPLTTVQYPEANPLEREAMSVQPRLLSIPELSHHLVESYLYCCLYVQEMLQYKRQNHGKFCAMMCSGCSVLAVVGHYVPGIMISYIIALSVLVWPLVVYHELIQRMYTGLEPILMKLDYSMKGDTQHHKHDKRKVKKEVEEGDEPRAETESESEEELSCFAPLVDAKTTALAMAITDSELSDEEASILESGGFSVSRATTPQLTDVCEDLDQQSVHSDPEEAFLRDLPEFPSIDEFPIEHSLLHFPLRGPGQGQGDGAAAGGREPSEGEPMSPASLLIQHLASPLHFVNTHFNGHGRPPGGDQGPPLGAGRAEVVVHGGKGESQAPRPSLEALSEEIVNTAISTVVQNTLSALLRSTEASKGPSIADFLPTDMPPSALESPPAPVAETEEAEKDQDVVAAESERSAEEMPDDMFVPTEDEDFELLDQSELEQMDEGLLGLLSPDGQGVVGVASPADTHPSTTHQPESF
ncbi:reticulophagy regulator 2 isoform X1 [Oncorhynchus tshawytscha]|uniref:RETREG1-3/ARL6IP-like N-terminal reticulon-homology domain-containing protein n=2 Tax=Oncorhynchus tshawytscha TaxID=74940 RepID=A0A8C8HX60_ONCTS|nr:reticulophagy regulator 2 isoform X1 [Oncorhynchus tshawytscha]